MPRGKAKMPDETEAPEVAEPEIAAELEVVLPRVGHVFVTVTKFGEGKVSTGEHVAELGDVMAKKGDILECPEDQAKIQEAFGLVEINA